MNRQDHKDFYRHYGSILAEDHARSGLPQFIDAFRESLDDRCPYLSEAEKASILACLSDQEFSRE